MKFISIILHNTHPKSLSSHFLPREAKECIPIFKFLFYPVILLSFGLFFTQLAWGATPTATVKKTHSTTASAKAPTAVKTAFSIKKKKLRDVIVILDPGHGGKDPGATGIYGIHEKKVVLAIAKDVKRQLENTSGYRVYLTRNSDYYIPLRGRLRIARRDKGDVFVSIHADAFKISKAEGASVFALSLHGASSEAARWLASRENHSELAGVNLSDKNKMLRSVLLDLSQTATITSSLHLGQDLLLQISRVSKLHSQRVEQAGFMVLKSPDIPSVLVETGFLSNPIEAQELDKKAYQKKIATAIAEGIKKYFSHYPPTGTFLSARKV